MKNYNELKTDAETIRDETSAGANTATRVGGHLSDMVQAMGKTRLNPADEIAPYRPNKPMVCFKYDGNNDFGWTSYLDAPDIYEEVYGGAVPLTFFVQAEAVKRPKIMDLTDVVFTAATTDGAGNVLVDGTIELPELGEARFNSEQFAAGNIISFVGTDNNDGSAENPMLFRIKSVNEDKTIITIWARAYMYLGTEYVLDNCVDETVSSGAVEVWRGSHVNPTYGELAALAEDGHTLGAYMRTARPVTAYRGFPAPSAAELWEEIYGAKRDMEAGLSGAGSDINIELLVHPTGQNTMESRQMARLAGYKAATGQNYTQTEYLHNEAVINPWAMEEINTTNACLFTATGTASCTAAGNTLTGNGTLFESEFEVGKPIVIKSGSAWQFRIIAGISSNTALTIEGTWDITINNSAVYDPTQDAIVDRAAYGSQSYCGFINHIIENGGMLIIGGHNVPSSASNLRQYPHGIALQYIKYLIGEGEDITLASMSECVDTYYPLVEAGYACSVSDEGMRIERALSPAFAMNDEGTRIGVDTALSRYGDYVTLLGYRAGMSQYGNRVTCIGHEAGMSNTKDSLTALGYQAGNANTGTIATVIGVYAGNSNTGSGLVAIGYQCGSNNDVANVVAIGHQAGYKTTGHTPEAGTFIVEHRGVTGDGANKIPLIKGWFGNGAIMLGCPSSAIADAKLLANRFTFYLDEANHKLKVKVCYANGTTYKLGEVALSDPA